MSDLASPGPDRPTTETGVAAPSPLTATPPAETRLTAGEVTWKARLLDQPRPRLWPGLLFVALMWALVTIPGWVAPGTFIHFLCMFWGPILCTLGIVTWWLFASRVRWVDRGLALLVGAAGGVAVLFLAHKSFGFFGLVMVGLPLVTTAGVGWLLLTFFLAWPARRVGLVVVMLLAWGYCTTRRFDGADGALAMETSWRWEMTPEERFLAEHAQKGDPVNTAAGEEVKLGEGDWPGFRGKDRDGRRTGVRISTDWEKNPPKPLWKQRVGPGWSSFAVAGDRLYTQEQRGPDEVVVCYRASTGKELWVHTDTDRFSETVGGPGPRATPTLHQSKVYALGANGRLNCLDAATGKVVWTRDIVEDSGAKVTQWGLSSSPLVVQGLVVVYSGADDGKGTLAYRADSGKPAWSAEGVGHSYCSPHLARLGGLDQVLIAGEKGMISYDVASGQVLWNHEWAPTKGMARVVQPAVVGSSDVLLGSGFNQGTRRLRIKHERGEPRRLPDPRKGWSADEEVWTTRDISPYFNDLVIHKGHLYGFDGMFFTCVSLDEGEKRWRVRGYGNGQVLLLPEQDLLLILSEKGAVALVEASPEQHRRLGQFQALKGKTWNHPVLAHGKLFVRNGEEMACYRVAPE